MRKPARTGAAALAFAALLSLALCAWGSGAHAGAPAAAAAQRDFGAQLRYVGRDPATGMPATVNDRFIAAVEQAVARYGKDEVQRVPPPPVEGLDVARLAIPYLGVDAPVGRYGLDNFGRLDVPQDTRTVGWNPAFTSLPGTGRATFFAAHVQFGGRPGVFNRLSTLREADDVLVTMSDGTVYRYRVTSVVDYSLASIDMGALMAGREGTESITLMTCSGPQNEGEFQYRTVVLAERLYE